MLPSSVDGDVLQEGVLAEAGVVGFDLVAGVEAVGLDEQAAGLEAAEAAVAVERAAVVLDQPGALVALAGQHRQVVLVLPLALRATNSE